MSSCYYTSPLRPAPPSPFSKPYLSQHSLLQPPNTYYPMKLSYVEVLFPILSLLAVSALPRGRLTHLSNCSIKIPPLLTPSLTPPGNVQCFLLHAPKSIYNIH